MYTCLLVTTSLTSLDTQFLYKFSNVFRLHFARLAIFVDSKERADCLHLSMMVTLALFLIFILSRLRFVTYLSDHVISIQASNIYFHYLTG